MKNTQQRMSWNDLLTYKEDITNIRTLPKMENDERNVFKRDFDKISSASSFRRLQDKAQIFPMENGDFVRTRLTHSLEVSSIAESLGQGVIETIIKNEDNFPKEIIDIPMILRSASLIHDLGNPPFGHITEGIIRNWFIDNKNTLYIKYVLDQETNKELQLLTFKKPEDTKYAKLSDILGSKYSDFCKIDGNAQALRVVSKLQMDNLSKGLNLSFPTIATIIKYPDGYHKSKKGYFYSEKELYDEIQSLLKLNNSRHPLTYILEAADDIAYLTADIIDANKKNLIQVSDIRIQLEKKYNEFNQPNLEMPTSLLKMKTLLDRIFTYEATYENNESMSRIMNYARGIMISETKKVFSQKYDKIMTRSYNSELLEDDSIYPLQRIFRDLLEDKVYYNEQIIIEKAKACKIVMELLPVFLRASFNNTNKGNSDTLEDIHYKMMSSNYRKMYESTETHISDSKNQKIKIRKKKILSSLYINKAYLLNTEEKEKYNNKVSETISNIKHEIEVEAESDLIYAKVQLAIDQLMSMTDRYAKNVYKNIAAIN